MPYTYKEVVPNIYHISEGGKDHSTLIVGETGAVLLDTMTGADDLKAFLKTLTDFDPIVINSHCHYDHVGGNWQFEPPFYLSPLDWDYLEYGYEQIPVLEETQKRPFPHLAECFTKEIYRPLEEGKIFDLGGITLETVLLPGHTPGSMGLLCPERRLLIAADAIAPQMCLFFKESLSLEDYVKLLDKVETLPFDHYITAHCEVLFEKRFIKRLREVTEIVGVKRGFTYFFTPLPYMKGRLYVEEFKCAEIENEALCIITKPEQPALKDGK